MLGRVTTCINHPQCFFQCLLALVCRAALYGSVERIEVSVGDRFMVVRLDIGIMVDWTRCHGRWETVEGFMHGLLVLILLLLVVQS